MIEKFEWDLSPLLKNDDDPQIGEKRKIIEKEINKFASKWRDRDDYLVDSTALLEALNDYEVLAHRYWPFNDESFYFHLRSTQDQNDPKIKAKLRNVDEFSTKLNNLIEFFPLKLSKIEESFQSTILRGNKFSPYKHFLEKLFTRAQHLLSESEEKILNLKERVAYENWVQMTSSFLSKEEAEVITAEGETNKVTFSELLPLMRNSNKVTRDRAASAFNKILEKYVDVAEAELNSVLADKKVNDELRNFPFPESSRLLSDDIEKEIVDKMIESVSGRFDISRRLYKLKAEIFGLKKLQYHERNIYYGSVNANFPFEKTKKIIDKITKQLDPEFNEIYHRFMKNKLIDVYPRKNKRDGAFCASSRLDGPTYILLNYNNQLNDVTTFAHELGHGINDALMKKKVNAINYGMSLAVAEVASTFMENFALDEISKNADEKMRFGILLNQLDSYVSSIFRQVACYCFEQELHKKFREKNYLSKEEIGKLFQKHMSAYMGEYVEQSPGSENWWVYWSHIRNYFYNYSYANGLLISQSLQAMVKKDPSTINKVKNIFSRGLEDSPRRIFLDEGINISKEDFWNKGLDEIDRLLKETEKLARELNKM